MEFSKEQLEYIEAVYYLGMSRQYGSFANAIRFFEWKHSNFTESEFIKEVNDVVEKLFPNKKGGVNDRKIAFSCATLICRMNTTKSYPEINAIMQSQENSRYVRESVRRVRNLIIFGSENHVGIYFSIVNALMEKGKKFNYKVEEFKNIKRKNV